MKPPWIISAKPGDSIFACEYRDDQPCWIRGKLLKQIDEFEYLVDVSEDPARCCLKRYHEMSLRSAAYCKEQSAPLSNVYCFPGGHRLRRNG